MPTVHVDDNEVARRGFYGTWVTLVSEVANKSERVEGYSVEEPVLPTLRVT